VVNADITIVAQAPKLSPYVDAMCVNISADLQVNASQVNVKATTTEHLGFTGRCEGIAAFAVVLLDTR
jgi:2-C-methyl-D-erythritol 2,4-cyclodiphosphate synthase